MTEIGRWYGILGSLKEGNKRNTTQKRTLTVFVVVWEFCFEAAPDHGRHQGIQTKDLFQSMPATPSHTFCQRLCGDDHLCFLFDREAKEQACKAFLVALLFSYILSLVVVGAVRWQSGKVVRREGVSGRVRW